MTPHAWRMIVGRTGGSAIVDVVVVGAGHAGLAASWHLRRLGVEHAVLEQGAIGDSWRTRR